MEGILPGSYQNLGMTAIQKFKFNICKYNLKEFFSYLFLLPRYSAFAMI